MQIIRWFMGLAVVLFFVGTLVGDGVRCEDLTFPQTEIISGHIYGSTEVSTRAGDTVIVYNQTQGDEEVTRGSVSDNQGAYSVSISLSSEFLGNILYFLYQKKDTGNIYELVESDQANANPVTLPFEGGGFPFPNVVEQDMYIGQLVSAGEGNGTNGGAATVSQYDVNGDGKITREDAAMVSRIRAGATRGLSEEQIGAADVNEDGDVNLNDIIEILRRVD